MQVRFLSDGSEYRSYGGGSLSQKKEKGGIFWWAILITLLMGAATFCWFFSIMVFSHPEKPFNYKVLAKFNKLTPLRPYSIYTTPNGKTFGARDIFGEFYAYSSEQLNVRNDLFKRSYLKNYQHEQPIYLLGNYRVLSTRPLNKDDVFTQGWIVRARASDLEDLDVELVMPGLAGDTAPYTAGDTFNLQKRNYATALHIQRMEEDRICVTVLPLAYKASAKAGQEIKEITLEPPTLLNMEGYWPITRDPGSEFALSQQQENNGIAATKP